MLATCLYGLQVGAGTVEGHAQRPALVCPMYLSVYKVL